MLPNGDHGRGDEQHRQPRVFKGPVPDGGNALRDLQGGQALHTGKGVGGNAFHTAVVGDHGSAASRKELARGGFKDTISPASEGLTALLHRQRSQRVTPGEDLASHGGKALGQQDLPKADAIREGGLPDVGQPFAEGHLLKGSASEKSPVAQKTQAVGKHQLLQGSFLKGKGADPRHGSVPQGLGDHHLLIYSVVRGNVGFSLPDLVGVGVPRIHQGSGKKSHQHAQDQQEATASQAGFFHKKRLPSSFFCKYCNMAKRVLSRW